MPQSWDKNQLLSCLRKSDESLRDLDARNLSLYPGCSGLRKTALLIMNGVPTFFLPLETNSKNEIFISAVEDEDDEKGFKLGIDCDLYNLTPLNKPGEDVIAE